MSVAARDRLRQRFFDRHGYLLPAGPLGQSGDPSQPERRPRLHAAGRAIGYVPRRDGKLPTPMPATVVAFYLPQFHPIPENDAWWGEGFTEWHNVTRALPQFEGHAQPRLPAELGFYDLRLANTMRQQMQLAHAYGIGAFCSYFYWFAGKTLLETPLEQWLADATLELPLCLCWANENWSRRWDGRANDILISQQHSPADDLAFIEHVSRYLTDARYLRVDGKPLLLVYRPGLLPDPKATAMRWRDWCRTNCVGEIQLAYVQSFDRVDPRDIGFDAAVEFPPNNVSLEPITASKQLINPGYRGDIYDWRELARQCMAQPDPDYPRYPGVNPGWDNEPRRSGRGRVFAHASPRGYRDWLGLAIIASKRRFPTQPMVFVNAWNEWAEGAVLEPDTRLGHAWLQATRDALHLMPVMNQRPRAVIHACYPELLDEIVIALHNSDIDWRIIITTTDEHEQAVRRCVQQLAIDAEIDIFENRGSDILPFLHVANRLLDEGVTTVLKVHNKPPARRLGGAVLQHELLAKQLAPEFCSRILSAFADDPTLGIVYTGELLQSLQFDRQRHENGTNVTYLCRILGIPLSQVNPESFIASNAIWLRLAALGSLLDANLDVLDFEDETGPHGGTLAQATEQIFGLAAIAAGFTTVSAAKLVGRG